MFDYMLCYLAILYAIFVSELVREVWLSTKFSKYVWKFWPKDDKYGYTFIQYFIVLEGKKCSVWQ